MRSPSSMVCVCVLLGSVLAAQPPRDAQLPDGRWRETSQATHAAGGEDLAGEAPAPDDARATAAMLLALLADGSTLKAGPHKEALKRGAVWMRNHQDERTGRIGTTTGADAAICAYAMAAACSLSRYRALVPVARRAIAHAAQEQERSDLVDPQQTVLVLLAARMASVDIPDDLRERALTQVVRVSPPLKQLGIELLLRDLAPANARHGAEIDRCAQVLVGIPLEPLERAPVDELSLMLATTALYRCGGAPWDAWSRKLGALFAARKPAADSTTARALRTVTATLYYRYGQVYGNPAPIEDAPHAPANALVGPPTMPEGEHKK